MDLPVKKRILVVGTTSAIAQHCARLWAETGPAGFVLMGRDAARLEQVAADLRVRSPQTRVQTATPDFLDGPSIQAAVDAAFAQGPIDLALVAHGSLPDQLACQGDLAACRQALEVNGTSPVLFAQAIAGAMERQGRGTLAVIGSVAGDRGRASNYVYGAAKAMVEVCLQGLQHRLSGSAVRVVLVKPGPTDTPMTAHLKAQGARLASVEEVAKRIVRAVEAGSPVVYAPGKWALIMWVIRKLPAFIFNRLRI